MAKNNTVMDTNQWRNGAYGTAVRIISIMAKKMVDKVMEYADITHV